MEWNPVLEQRLKTARGKAGWRWIGYTGILFGFVVLVGGGIGFTEAMDACKEQAGPFEECKANSGAALFFAPGALFILLGFIVALPAEKSAKEAKELLAQKQAAGEIATAPMRTCASCGASVAGRFCTNCGTPQPISPARA